MVDTSTRSVASDQTASTTQAMVRSSDGSTSSQLAGSATTQMTGGMTVAIQTPVTKAEFEAGALIHFAAQATSGGRDVSAQVVWSSNLEGVIGSGASMTKVLGGGVHTISAMITDSNGISRRASIVVIVHGE